MVRLLLLNTQNVFFVDFARKKSEKLDCLSDKIQEKYSCVIDQVCVDALVNESGISMYKTISQMDTKPDIVVHHVGGTSDVRSTLSDRSKWIEVLQLNVLFAAEFNSSYIPYLLERDIPARIIHVSSISALSLRGSGPYAAAKAFLNAYIITTAREVATSRVTVCGVMPGACTLK